MANGTEIAKAYVQIVPTTDGIKQNLAQAFGDAESTAGGAGSSAGSSFVSGFGSVIAGIAQVTAVAVGAAVAGISAITKQAVAAYAEYEQLTGGVETLFGTQGLTLEQYADKVGKSVDEVKSKYGDLDEAQNFVLNNAADAYKRAGLSSNEYMEQATSFAAALITSLDGDTIEAAALADQAIVDMSDNANKMGTSIESIQNAYQGFAKQNYTMLDNLKLGYGGTKSEMERLLADAEAISGIKYDISSYADVVAAIHVMQEQMGITGTTALEAEHTISGSLGMMKASWSNLITGIADDNQDFKALTDNLVSSATVAMQNLIPRITIALQGAANVISQLAPMLVEMLPGMIDAFLPPLLEGAVMIVNTLVENLPLIVQPIIDQMPVIIDMLLQILPEFVNGLLSLMPQLIDAGMQIITNILIGIAEAIPLIIPQITLVMQQIIDVIGQNGPLMLNAALQLMQALANGLLQAIPAVVEAIPSIINSIIDFLTQSIPEIIKMGVQLLTSLINDLPTIISNIVNSLPSIIDGICNFLIENLPIIVDAGVQLFMALIENLPEIIEAIVAALPEIVSSIVSALLKLDYQIIKCGFDLLVSLVKDLPLILAEIIVALDKLIDGMIECLAAAIVSFVETGKNIIDGIAKGIVDAKDAVINKIKDMCEEAWDAVKSFFGIASPSKLMKWAGQMVDEGLAFGIANNADLVVDSALAMTNDVMDVVDGLNSDMNEALNSNMKIASNATLDIDANNSTTNNTLAMIQESLNELNARFNNGIDIEWDDRQLGRLVQTYA